MNQINPLASFQEGWDVVQGIRDQRTNALAGRALAGGDYQGGANALLSAGRLQDGMAVQGYGQRQQAGMAEQQKAQEAEARRLQAEHMKTLLNSAQGLRQLPPEARKQAYETQVKPILLQMGLDQDAQGQMMLSRWEQAQFTDGELDPFIATMGGELEKPEWQIVNPGGGRPVYAVDQNNPANRITVAEEDPLHADYQRARIDATRAQVGQREAAAAKSRRPPAGRGGGRRGGGQPKPPAGFIVDP